MMDGGALTLSSPTSAAQIGDHIGEMRFMAARSPLVVPLRFTVAGMTGFGIGALLP
jgi:hypothetical protein